MDAEQDGEQSEAALEQQIQEHLIEHRDSLTALNEALVCDPHNQELLEVHEELSAALKSAEESLLQLKRSRLLREIDLVLDVKATNSTIVQSAPRAVSNDHGVVVDSSFSVGSKCRFRHANGRWYYGQILEADCQGFARVSFLTPTTEKMQMCKFYMQQRCRFGESCRMSHGILVRLDALKKFDLLKWLQPCAGSAVLACAAVNGEGLWRQAELESWNESLQCGTAVFIHDGSRLDVGIDNLSLSECAQDSDEGNTSSEEDDEEFEDETDYSFLGLGVLGTAETGPQLDTRIFANWEKHTRGVASKMMANMGYREGMGLGKTGQGIVLPLQVRVLPKYQSLDFISKGDNVDQEKGKKKKKKSRGGKRKRDKKLADAARAAKSEESKRPDVFGFINNQLAGQVGLEGEERESTTSVESDKMKSGRQVKARTHREDRKSLMVQADEIAELQSKVEKLEEMALRNRKDKAFHEAISRKLQEARKDLLTAERTHASTSLAVQSKEKEKRWLKF
ncbi:hypothetical protein GOP47_0027284 [Adiantum capillus-veneris]|nr:hypothetical protein GOP47_0027284 [Adiantum capillus-veneris]